MTSMAPTRLLDAMPTEMDPRWRSVVARNGAADGTFYYSVATTGVYCIPSCAARLAKPEHVRIHATREEAERAGFRPCKRCKPDQLEMNRQTPEEIRFAIGDSSLGQVLVAGSADGVTAILLGDDSNELRRDLAQRFPRATLVADDPSIAPLAERVIAMIESPSRAVDVPLDVRGTAFQRRVWEALRAIPAGSTATYTAIAQRLGMPNSARAVAQACAANPLAVVVPCHRVVRADGGLSGYRWGVTRKRALLDRERGASVGSSVAAR